MVLLRQTSQKKPKPVWVSYQKMDISGIARGGLPSFYTDGSLIDWSRSDSNAADWTYSDRTTTAYFADVEHQFNDRWKLKGTASRTITASDEVVGYIYSNGIDKQTGAGAMIYATRWDYEPTQDLFNLTLNGSFDLLSQTHEVVLGTTYAKSKNKRPTYSSWNNNYTWDGDR
jgi:outer membrane receptor for ferric coprogen and ferric-rhodotorulic acid